MTMHDHEALLESIRQQRAHHPLSTLTLAEPLLSAQGQIPQTQSPNSDSYPDSSANTTNQADAHLNPVALAADLQHYRDLFSKLRFSYLEQVTKEKYLRSIVGDPPVLVTHEENLALEDKLVAMKSELKAKKAENEQLVRDMEALAQRLAEKYAIVETGISQLETLPQQNAALRSEVDALRDHLRRKEAEMEVQTSDDPQMNMSLADTVAAVDEQKRRVAEVDEQIAALQRDLPPKVRECERAERELEELEGRRNEVTKLVRDLRRIKEEGGRDVLEEKGRWYRAEEQTLRGLLGAEG